MRLDGLAKVLIAWCFAFSKKMTAAPIHSLSLGLVQSNVNLFLKKLKRLVLRQQS